MPVLSHHLCDARASAHYSLARLLELHEDLKSRAGSQLATKNGDLAAVEDAIWSATHAISHLDKLSTSEDEAVNGDGAL
jgi:hypothetical protein